MNTQEFNELLEAIKNQTLTDSKLEIYGDQLEPVNEESITDEQTILLANALKYNTHITTLDIGYNNISDKGAIALSSIDTLQELILDGNNITEIGMETLANTNLKRLSLEYNSILCQKEKYMAVKKMINAYIENKTITDLNLGSCGIPDEMIASLIWRSTTIKVLSLGRDIGDQALEFIGNNRKLENLRIYENRITDKGAKYISQNISLVELNIYESNITNEGAYFLSKHQTLKTIFLHDSDITVEGARFFINSNLDNIGIHSNIKQYIMSWKEIYSFYKEFNQARQNSSKFLYLKENYEGIEINYEITEKQLREEQTWVNTITDEDEYYAYLMGDAENI